MREQDAAFPVSVLFELRVFECDLAFLIQTMKLLDSLRVELRAIVDVHLYVGNLDS